MGDEHLRKQHRSLAELHYSKAVGLFLSLKDAPCELLRTLLERVAFAEFTMAGEGLFVAANGAISSKMFGFVFRTGLSRRTSIFFFFTASSSIASSCVSSGQSSSAAKLKSLTGAIQIMADTRHAFKLIHNELLEEQVKVTAFLPFPYSCFQSFDQLPLSRSHTVPSNIFILSALVPQLSESDLGESAECADAATDPTSELNLQEVMKLIGVFEPSFSFLLLQLIKLMTTMKRKPR